MSLVFLNFFSKRMTPAVGDPAPATLETQRTAARTGGCIPRCTELERLRGKRLLCVLDGDNLDYSLMHQGLQLRYRELYSRLKASTQQVFGVVVLTSAPGDARRAQALHVTGWRVVSIPWETITTFHGTRKRANADLEIAYELGCLASVGDCDAALIGTGDGDLATSGAAALRRSRRHRGIEVHALSVAGASSARLRQRTDLFDSNILIGQDLLERTSAGHVHPLGHAPQGGSHEF